MRNTLNADPDSVYWEQNDSEPAPDKCLWIWIRILALKSANISNFIQVFPVHLCIKTSIKHFDTGMLVYTGTGTVLTFYFL
jgi:hypothetical protein